MGEFASWRHIIEQFGVPNNLEHFTDGGKGYSPRADFHVKWHADRDGVVDRFHVTRESDKAHVYYLLDASKSPALTKHAGGQVSSDYYRHLDLRSFDQLAVGFVNRVIKAMTARYATAKAKEADLLAAEGAVKVKQADAGAFMARRGAAFGKARDRSLTALTVTVGGIAKSVEPKSTLLAMKAPYSDHEEMLTAIEAALTAGPTVATPTEKLVESGVTNTASKPSSPPAPIGQQIVHLGPPGHWEVKPVVAATGSRPPGL